MSKRYDAGKDWSGIAGLWWKDTDGTVIKNTERASTKDLTAYPWPDRSRSRFKDYYLPGTKQPMVTTAITSRGCPHSCPFCLTYKKQYRIREIDDILDEMEHCVSLGITETHFIDDLFTPMVGNLAAALPANGSADEETAQSMGRELVNSLEVGMAGLLPKLDEVAEELTGALEGDTSEPSPEAAKSLAEHEVALREWMHAMKVGDGNLSGQAVAMSLR